MRFDNMVLYAKPGCPFCHRVIDFMKANDIEIDILNSMEPANREKLVEMNGTTQTPCLVVDGQPMLESADIIAYLEARIA